MPAPAPVKEEYTGLMAEHANARVRVWPFSNRRKSDDHTPGGPPPPAGPEDHRGFGGNKPPQCDRCMQAAKWEVIINEALKMRLFFCGHHFSKHELKLMGYQGIRPVNEE